MFGDKLCECDKYSDLKRHLAVIPEVVSVGMCFLQRNPLARMENSQEDRIPKNEVFEPIQAEGNYVGDTNGYNNKLQRLSGTPQPFHISQRCRYEQQGENQLHDKVSKCPFLEHPEFIPQIWMFLQMLT